jgi:DNA-binding transcriptional LysR family regulator
MLTSLKIFADLVDRASFSRAAEENHLTRSAVSQRIKHLEEMLCCRLVSRSRAGATPTKAGEALYRACRDVLFRYEELLRELDELGQKVAGRLRLGAVTSVGLHELSPHVKRCLERYPAVEVALQYLTSQEIYRRVNERDLDLGIVAFPSPNATMVTMPLHRDELVVIVPPGHRLASSRGAIAPARLRGELFVAFDPELPTGHFIEQRLRHVDVRMQVVHHFDNVETIKRAVEIGAGVAIVPWGTADQEVGAGTLARVRLKGGDWTRPIAVIHRKDRPPGPVARAFISVLGESASTN